MKRKLRKLILAAVSGLILFQTGFFFSPQTKLEAEARSGQVTEYFNEEEGEKRTIYWASGITPPKPHTFQGEAGMTSIRLRIECRMQICALQRQRRMDCIGGWHRIRNILTGILKRILICRRRIK